MAISKKTQSHSNDMLLILASLACGQNDSKVKPSMSRFTAISDTSDDDTSTSTIETMTPERELKVARRRRRPIKKRLPMGDYRSSSLMFLDSSIKPRKSLLEKSIDIVSSKKQRKRSLQAASARRVVRVQEPRVEPPAQARVPALEQESDTRMNLQGLPHLIVDEDVPALVSDDETWEEIHSPLSLPSFLPCPTEALQNVSSICLTLEER